MGDARYGRQYERVLRADDRLAEIRAMSGEEVVQALAAASREADPLLANVLATEALNRIRRVRTAIDHLGEGLCLLDGERRIMLFNPAAERLTGWRREEVEGRPIEDALVPPGTWGEVLQTRRPLHSEEECFTRKEGRVFPVSCTVAPVMHGEEVDGVVIVFRDATQERQAEQDRRAWQTYVEACHEAHDVLGEGLVLVEGMRVVHANETFLRMSGYALEDLRALPGVTALVPEAYRPDLARGLGETGLARQHHVRTRLLRRDGETVKVEVAGIAVQRDAHPTRVVCIVRKAVPEAEARPAEPAPWP